MKERKVSLHRFHRVLSAMFVAAGAASAQLPPPASLPDFDFNQLLAVPAIRILAQSSTPNLISPMTLLRYQFEEIALPFTVQIDAENGTQFYHTAVRFRISGGPFFVGDEPPVVWIGAHRLMAQPSGVWLDNGLVNQGVAAELAGIIYDRSILRNGLAIGVNYSFEELDPTDLFPELLRLNP